MVCTLMGMILLPLLLVNVVGLHAVDYGRHEVKHGVVMV